MIMSMIFMKFFMIFINFFVIKKYKKMFDFTTET